MLPPVSGKYMSTDDGELIDVVKYPIQGLLTTSSLNKSTIDGNMFRVEHIRDLLQGDTADYAFRTPNIQDEEGRDLVVILALSTLNTNTDDVRYTLYEDVIVSGYGDLINEINLNRNSTNSSELQIYANSSVDVTGATAITDSILFGVAGRANSPSVGGLTSFDAYTILKPDTDYDLRLTNNGGADGQITIKIVHLEIFLRR